MITNILEKERLMRQQEIITIKNPNMANEYLCKISCQIKINSPIEINLCYIPDKLIISEKAFNIYLSSLKITKDIPIETIAHIILDDLNNELVAKWIQIIISADINKQGSSHKILLEDRQPRWNNIDLLNRISQF